MCPRRRGRVLLGDSDSLGAGGGDDTTRPTQPVAAEDSDGRLIPVRPTTFATTGYYANEDVCAYAWDGAEFCWGPVARASVFDFVEATAVSEQTALDATAPLAGGDEAVVELGDGETFDVELGIVTTSEVARMRYLVENADGSAATPWREMAGPNWIEHGAVWTASDVHLRGEETRVRVRATAFDEFRTRDGSVVVRTLPPSGPIPGDPPAHDPIPGNPPSEDPPSGDFPGRDDRRDAPPAADDPPPRPAPPSVGDPSAPSGEMRGAFAPPVVPRNEIVRFTSTQDARAFARERKGAGEQWLVVGTAVVAVPTRLTRLHGQRARIFPTPERARAAARALTRSGRVVVLRRSGDEWIVFSAAPRPGRRQR